MSRKPTIKISYPDASDVAMKLTEAMVRRAPGRRVVETTSEDSASPAGGELFADFDACSTSTSVDLTLTLNSASMDYALETLIRPNLTADERKRILGDSASGDDLLPGSAPAEEQTAPDQEKQIEIGKIPDRELRTILADLSQNVQTCAANEEAIHIQDAIDAMNYQAGVVGDTDQDYIEANELTDMLAVLISFSQFAQSKKKMEQLSTFADRVCGHIQRMEKEDAFDRFCIPVVCLLDSIKEADLRFRASRTLAPYDEFLNLKQKGGYVDDIEYPKNGPSWKDVEREAQALGKDKTDKTDKTDDIEPGLLNDLDDGSDGMAPAEEVMGHDE